MSKDVRVKEALLKQGMYIYKFPSHALRNMLKKSIEIYILSYLVGYFPSGTASYL